MTDPTSFTPGIGGVAGVPPPIGSTGVVAPVPASTSGLALDPNATYPHPSSATVFAKPEPTPANLSEDPRLERVVLAYLQRRGFSQAEAALLKESKSKQTTTTPATTTTGNTNATTTTSSPSTTPDIHTFAMDLSLDQHTHLLKQILHYSLEESSPDLYAHAYEQLKQWISECLALYRTELEGVLWPIYCHIFIQLIHRGFPIDAHRFFKQYRPEFAIKYTPELCTFQNIMTDSELQKCEMVRWFMQRKVEVPMSAFSYQLLISFLEEKNFVLLLKIVNEHITVKIMSRRPLPIEPDQRDSMQPGTTIGQFTPLNPMSINFINTQPIRWGVLPEYATIATEAQQRLRNRLKDEQLTARMAKQKELEARAAAAAEEKAREKDASEKKKSTEEKEGGVKDEGEEGEESVKKKAKLEDGTAAATTVDGATASASPSPPTAAAADVEMTDAAGEDVAAGTTATTGGDEKEKKKKKKNEPAGGVNPLKETKEDKDAIEKIVKKSIKVPEAMVLPTEEKKVVSLPPISADTRLRFLADINYRQKLSSSSLPSICFYTFLNSLSTVNSISISPDSSLVSCGLSDSTVRLYDLRDPTIRASTNPQQSEHKDDLDGLHGGATKEAGRGRGLLDPTANLSETEMFGTNQIITGSSIINRRLGDEATMKLPYTKLVGHSGPVYSTSLSPEGQYLISGSEDCTIRLWHLETKKNLVIYKGHNYPVWNVAFSSLGYYFASGSHDGTARLWSTNHVAPLRMFVGHNSDVDVVKFHPNCNYVATGSSDTTARLWDIQSGECVRLFVGHTGGIRSLAMDPEGRYCSTGGEDGKVIVWDLGTGRQVTSYHLHTAPVTSLEYSADAEILASGSLDYSIQLLEPKKPHISTPIRTFHTKKTPVHYLSFTPRNLLLAAGIFNA